MLRPCQFSSFLEVLSCCRVCSQVLSQAALLEFHKGSADRGRSIFESILRNYPKRLDLWSVYLDQVTLGDANRPYSSLLQLCAAVTHRNISAHAHCMLMFGKWSASL